MRNTVTSPLFFPLLLGMLFPVQFCQSQDAARPQSGTGKSGVLQTRDILDVRDYGVDCTFTSDSSVALNAVTATAETNGHAITFPPKCHVRLGRTWLIRNLSGFTIRGTSGAGNNGYYATNVPTITWTGAEGGTMIDMQHADGFRVENLAIDGGGLAAIGINVDKAEAGGTVNTTDGIFQRLFIHGNMRGGASSARWIGIQFSKRALSNVEDMRVIDSNFYCGTGETSGVAAIVLGPSFNDKNFLIQHNFIHQCAIGVWQQGGSAVIDANEVGSNKIDFKIDYWSDPNEVISENLSESATGGARFLVFAGNVNHSVEISSNNIPVNNACAITVIGGTFFSGNGNTFYNGFGGGAGGKKLCNLGPGPAFLAGTGWSHNLTQSDLANFVTVPPNGSHSVIDTLGFSNAPRLLVKSTGSTFLERAVFYNLNDGSAGFANSGQLQNGLPCGLNTWCGMEGGYEVAGVNSPDGLSCTTTGNDKSAMHVYLISAVDSAGYETMLRGNANSANCRGPATYDDTHYETLIWLASPNASSYNLYAANPLDQIRIQQIATGITGSSYQVHSYPKSFAIIAIRNPYNRTLSHIFRGRDLELQYGTSLRGFRDKGVTQVFSLSPDGLQLGASGSALSQMKLYSTGAITPAAVRSSSCSDQTFTVKGLTTADRLSNIVPPSSLGNVSLNGYASAPDTLILHFCNPSASDVTPPAGVYSILAFR